MTAIRSLCWTISTSLLVAMIGLGCSDDAPDARATGAAGATSAPAATGPAARVRAESSAASSAGAAVYEPTSQPYRGAPETGDGASASGGLLHSPNAPH